jgi:LysR family transcriptional regulator, regulator of abg operon
MRLQHLQLLLTLARTGSLRASAEALNVTQPALTKALKQLEDEFGTVLVVRMPKGVRLAPAGELLAARAATVLRELDRAREEVGWFARNERATVTVGISPAAALLLAPGALGRFHARWPRVTVRLTDALYPKAQERLRSGELDMALGPLPAAGPGHDLRAVELLHSASAIVAPRNHPLRRARHLRDLADAQWILTGPRLGPGDPTHLGFEKLGLPPPLVVLECDSFSILLALLPASDALAVVPRHFFEIHGPRMGLVALDIAEPLMPITIHLTTRAEGPLTLPSQRLRDAFEQEAREVRAGRAAVATP